MASFPRVSPLEPCAHLSSPILNLTKSISLVWASKHKQEKNQGAQCLSHRSYCIWDLPPSAFNPQTVQTAVTVPTTLSKATQHFMVHLTKSISLVWASKHKQGKNQGAQCLSHMSYCIWDSSLYNIPERFYRKYNIRTVSRTYYCQ